MKISIEARALLAALQRLNRIVEKRNTIPILGNVLLTAQGTTLSVRGTDLDIEATIEATADISVPGTITVPYSLLSDITKRVPNTTHIILEGNDSGATVKAGRSRFKLLTLPPSDYPGLQTASGDQKSVSFTMDSADLQHLMKASFTMSDDASRFYLCGVHLHTFRTKLRAVATNGVSLVTIDIPMPEGAKEMPSIIIPSKTINALSQFFGGNEKVTVSVSENLISFSFSGARLVSKLIDGTFPDYARVIPRDNDKRLVAMREELADAIDRVSVIGARGRVVKLSINDASVEVTMQNADSGSAADTIEVDYESSPMDIGANATFLKDVLKAFSGEKVCVLLANPATGILVTDPDDDTMRCVIMPIAV